MRPICLSLLCLVSAASDAAAAVIERGPHHDVHEVIFEMGDPGAPRIVTNRYTVLQPGLNYFSPEENRWNPSSPEINLAQAGAAYRKGPFRLDFAPNHNDPVAAIALTLPDGSVVKIKTIGIALTEANGESVWLGELKDSNGFLDGNAIVYPDAFTGLKADIVVKVSIGKYESDVILREQIIPPQTIGFDPVTSTLEIWHKIVESPEPRLAVGRIQRVNGSVDSDLQLAFGDMLIGEGTAFLAGPDQTPLAAPAGAIKVAKHHFEDAASNAKFLIERIPYAEAAAHLQTLPARQEARFDRDKLRSRLQRQRNIAISTVPSGKPQRTRPVSLFEAPLPPPDRETKETKVAAITPGVLPRSPGFVMDYTVLVGISNFRFRGDTTYYCTNEVNLTGSPVIEGGTVVKFPPYNGVSRINFYGKVDCQTSPYSMAVFTADADNSVGETISTNSLSGFYGRFNLYFAHTNPYAQDLHDIRSGYTYWGIVIYGTNTHNLSNMQFMNCFYGIQALDTTIYCQNLLCVSNSVPFYGNGTTYHAEHVTAHTADRLFAYPSGGSGSLYLTNSLVIGMTYGSSPGVTTDHVTILSGDSGVFQTVGAGAHYLAPSSAYRNVGTANVSANMHAILKRTTTYSPVELSGSISTSTTLTPQVPRDTDVPDLGYHLPSLDYLWGNLSVAAGSTLLLTNGVAVGIHSTSGAVLHSGSKLISEGKPHLMNRLVRHNTVQEQPITYGTTGANMTLVTIANAPAIKPDILLRFTEISVVGDASARRRLCDSSDFNSISVRDCRLWNLTGSYDPPAGSSSFALTNNILERCDLTFTRSANLHQMAVDLRNNYVSRSALTFNFATNASSPPTWKIHDNFFDTTSLAVVGGAPYLLCSYNGFYATTIPAASGGGDQSPADLDFQTGLLGPYYYPAASSPSAVNLWTLVNHGSQPAEDASLYHYTTRVDQVNDQAYVDIGFHYIGTDSAGLPLDSDGDGIFDYQEDQNGNGDPDSNESSWTSAVNSSGGLIVYTPLQP